MTTETSSCGLTNVGDGDVDAYLLPARGRAMMGSETALRKVLEVVDVNLSAALPDIEKAFNLGDQVTAHRLLHGIKGYVPIMCSDALIELVKRVEQLSKTDALSSVKEEGAALLPQLTGLLKEVRAYLGNA